MKHYLIVYPSSFSDIYALKSRIELFLNNGVDKYDFIGIFGLEDIESFIIFAIEGHFDLNLVTKISESSAPLASVGTLDEDEKEWVTALNFAA